MGQTTLELSSVVSALVPSSLFRTEAPDTEPGPVGAPGHKDFLCPLFLWVQEIGFIQPPWLSVSSNGQIQAVVNWGREGMRDQGETVKRNNSAALGQGPGSPARDTHDNIFELFCRDWNPLQVGEVNDDMLPTSTETPDQLELEGWWCRLLLTSPPTNQKNVHELITPSLNHFYKTPHYPPQVGTHMVFQGRSRCVPLCLAK